MAGISDAARGKLAAGDITAFNISRVICSSSTTVGPEKPAKGKKPDPNLHHLRIDEIHCVFEGQSPNARKPGPEEKGKRPAFEQQSFALKYGFTKGTRFFKKGDPQVKTSPPELKFTTLIELSGKWYLAEVVDAGADGLLDGPHDFITVSDYYDMSKIAEIEGDEIRATTTVYTSDPKVIDKKAEFNKPVQGKPSTIPVKKMEKEGGKTVEKIVEKKVLSTLVIVPNSEVPKEVMEPIRAALLGALQAAGVEVTK